MKNKLIPFFLVLTAVSFLSLGFMGGNAYGQPVSKKPNILFISVDDLRPAIGAYGDTIAVTPNMDRLASQSRIFTRHYVYAPICGPSRGALLEGRRTGLNWDVWKEERKLLEEQPKKPVSMPDYFQRHGYRTISIGKISHLPGGTVPPTNIQPQVPFSWDVVTGPTGQWGTPWRAFFGYAGGNTYNAILERTRREAPRLPFEHANVSDMGYPDGLTANLAVEQLEQLAKKATPFFLAVGFFKPHLPHNAPRRYWNMYSKKKIGMPPNPEPAEGIDPDLSIHQSFEVTTHYYWPWGKGNISRSMAINQRWAYYACVSYTDAQIGKVLAALKKNGLDENTIIVLWGDHGWHLGEEGLFGKQTLFEVATRSPLMIRSSPYMNAPGKSTKGIVSTLDIYPTLAELAGLPTPKGLDGVSIAPMVRDPDHPGKGQAFSVFERHHPAGSGVYGRAVRADRWHYIEWRDVKTQEIHHVELYDHDKDPHETINVANQHPNITAKFRKLLQNKNLGLSWTPQKEFELMEK